MTEKLFYWYLANQDELVKKYNGKVLVIVANAVAGAYESEKDAYAEAMKSYAPGAFIIQRCSPGDRDYTQTFHSRIVLA